MKESGNGQEKDSKCAFYFMSFFSSGNPQGMAAAPPFATQLVTMVWMRFGGIGDHAVFCDLLVTRSMISFVDDFLLLFGFGLAFTPSVCIYVWRWRTHRPGIFLYSPVCFRPH